jgi:pimeloyl-ACP methyl ester carboxylesterase
MENNVRNIASIEFIDKETTLRGKFFEPDVTGEYPLVILATGDGSSGSNGLTWTNITSMLAKAGIGSFLFDFAGLGNSNGERRSLTLPIGISNFSAVMKQVHNHKGHDPERIGVIGASFGGNIALLVAADYPEIKAVGLKSPCCYLPEAFLCEYGEKEMARWAELGYTEEAGFNYIAVEEALRISTYAAAEKIQVPVLIIHGTADSAVPIRQSRDLLRLLKNGRLIPIEGADHWYANGDEWEQMANNLVDFMAKTL